MRQTMRYNRRRHNSVKYWIEENLISYCKKKKINPQGKPIEPLQLKNNQDLQRQLNEKYGQKNGRLLSARFMQEMGDLEMQSRNRGNNQYGKLLTLGQQTGDLDKLDSQWQEKPVSRFDPIDNYNSVEGLLSKNQSIEQPLAIANQDPQMFNPSDQLSIFKDQHKVLQLPDQSKSIYDQFCLKDKKQIKKVEALSEDKLQEKSIQDKSYDKSFEKSFDKSYDKSQDKSYEQQQIVIDIKNDPIGDHQRAAILALSKQEFDVQNLQHQRTLTSVRNKLAQYLPNHTLETLKVQIDIAQQLTENDNDPIIDRDNLFEKDITESIGFTNGLKPWEDLLSQNLGTNHSFLGLLCTQYFCERIAKIYNEAYKNMKVKDKRNILMENLLYISQNSPEKVRLDGFPLILLIFEIVTICLNLVDDKRHLAKNEMQKQEIKYWKHHQKVFRLISYKYFDNNMYETLNEYVYHMIMSFILGWRDSMTKVTSQLQWNIEQDVLRAQQNQQDQEKDAYSIPTKSEYIIYLYRALFIRHMDTKQPNQNQIENYRDMMDEVEQFVFTNIHELVQLRQNQTDFKILVQRLILKNPLEKTQIDIKQQIMMKKLQNYMQNQIERSSDIQQLKKIVNHLRYPRGKPVDIIKTEHQHSNSNNLEYIIIGKMGDQDYDEALFYIQNCRRLCKYSFEKKAVTPGGIYTSQTKIYCFKIFDLGKYILIGGEGGQDRSALQALEFEDGYYTRQEEVTENINSQIVGNVYQMQVSEKSKKIFLVDNVKHLVLDGKDQIFHRLLKINYQTKFNLSLKLKNKFKHKTEIYHYIFKENSQDQDGQQQSIFVSDFDGETYKLSDSLRVEQKLPVLSENKRGMGYMDMNDDYLFQAVFGTTKIRKINRETFEEKVIDTGIMSHYIKIYNDYLFIVDMNCFYIFDLNKNQVIATYETNGKVTALSSGDLQKKQAYGFTTEGQLFRIDLEIKEQMLIPFLEKDRVLSFSSEYNQVGSKQVQLNCSINLSSLRSKNKSAINSDDQPIFILDHRQQFHQLSFDFGKFVPKLLVAPKDDQDLSQRVIMTNIGHCLLLTIGSKILMKENAKAEFKTIREGHDKPNIIALIAKENIQEQQALSTQHDNPLLQKLQSPQKEPEEVNTASQSKYQIVFLTQRHNLVSMDEKGKVYNELKQGYIQNIHKLQDIDQGLDLANIAPIRAVSELDQILTMAFIDIQGKQYVIIAIQKTDNRSSVLKLASLPDLKLRSEDFAEVPSIVTCLKLSYDKKYLAVGCVDGQIMFYHIFSDTHRHEIYEKFQAHSFKVTDMVFIGSNNPLILNQQKINQAKEDTVKQQEDQEEDLLTTSNKEYLLASVSYDRCIVIISLKQRLNIFKRDLKQFLVQICYHSPSNKILIRCQDSRVFELDLNIKLFKDQQISHQQSLISSLLVKQLVSRSDQIRFSELRLEIMRQYLHSENAAQQAACLSYFDNTSLIFRKMNIATISAAFGSRQGLMVAFDNNISLMNTIDGTSLLDLTKSSQVFNEIIFGKIVQDQDYIFVSQEDDFFLSLLNLDIPIATEVVKNLLMNSKFTDRNSNLILGKIIRDNNILETEQLLISASDREHIIDISMNDCQEIVIFQTLKVPLILQRGNPYFIKLLAGLSRMPDNSREQKPVQILVNHLLRRDGNYVVLMHVPYVVMAILTYLYMMQSVKYLQQGSIHGLPMRELIKMCAIFFLVQRILEIPPLIMFARPINMIKLLSIIVDFILVAATMAFMKDHSHHDHELIERMEVFKQEPSLQWWMNIMIVCIFWNLLEVLRLFKSTRTISQYFIYVIWDLRPFMLILFIMIIGFTMLELLNMPQAPSNQDQETVFTDILLDQYQRVFGENPDHRHQTNFQRFIFIVFTIMVNTVNLNLLISIIAIVLDDLQMKKTARDIQTQLDIFLSFNCNFYLVKRLIKCIFKDRFENILDNRPKYIHYVSTEMQDLDAIDDSNDEYEGRVKVMIKRQDHIIDGISKLRKVLKKEQAAYDEDMNKMNDAVIGLKNFVHKQNTQINRQLNQISMNAEVQQLQDYLKVINHSNNK